MFTEAENNGAQEQVQTPQINNGFEFLKSATFTEEEPKIEDKKPEEAEKTDGGANEKTEGQEGADPIKPEVTNITQENDKGGDPAQIELDDDQLSEILSDATKGLVKDVNHLLQIGQENQRLQAEIKQLRENPADIFSSPEQKKIYEFLSGFKGNDYEAGLQTYARLQSLDITNMNPEDALREDYIMEQAKYGIPRNEAEQMFSTEFDEKYSQKGELAKNFIQKDSYLAKQRLQAAKTEFTTPKVDEQKDDSEQKLQQVREDYVKAVEDSISGYKSLSLVGLTENPENDFTFEVPDLKPIADALNDYQGYFSQRYVTPDGKVNTEQLKMDTTRIIYQEKIDKMLFDHGTNVGREMEIAKRNNIPNKNEKPVSNISGQGGNHKTLAEAILAGEFK